MGQYIQRSTRVLVVVLGDFGRSPRMQYHALSFANQAGCVVEVLSARGTNPLDEIMQNQRITQHQMLDIPRWMGNFPTGIRLVLKAMYQIFQLMFYLLYKVTSPDIILLQVPPALPTLPACWIASLWHRAQFVVDWHNFGFTLMALSMGENHSLVRAAKRLEKFWGRRACLNFCVTRAMQSELAASWGISAVVFYDRPPAFFRRASLPEQHNLLLKLNPVVKTAMHSCDIFADREICVPNESQAQNVTVLTYEDGSGAVRERTDRPALVVSSTSWSPDEDFGILLEAARLYDVEASKAPDEYPDLLLFITGKGPQKAAYERQMQQLVLRRVAFRTVWLEARDYPVLLGAADLGASLHTSSSGLDLPMKVVDMLGCGLPVCAADYNCIGELVQEGRNGVLFSTPAQLAAHLLRLLRGFCGRPTAALAQLRRGAAEFAALRWAEAWAQVVQPAILR